MPARICRKFFFVFLILALPPVFASAQSELININTADSSKLQDLNGIGPSKAQAIIDYRNANGPFQTIEDITKVSGIPLGGTTYANIKDFITVGGADVPEDEEEEETPTVTNTSVSSGDSNSSVHYGSSPLSTKKSAAGVALSAGRNRLGSVGSPLEFMVDTDMGYTRSSIFKWNFGDGSESAGDVLNHTYEYPGEYVVVLNASTPGGQVVARTNVKIIEPELGITLATPERIEIKNNSKYEVNLFGRVLTVGNSSFAFPQDTIVRPGQSISFASKITNLFPTAASAATILTVGGTEQSKLTAKIEEKKSERIAYLQNQIASLKEHLASISQPTPHLAVQQLGEPSEDLAVEEFVEPDEVEVAEPQTATAKEGWLAVLKRFFLRTQ